MPKLATWIREKDEKWFQPFFDQYPEIEICDARKGEIAIRDVAGLLLTGGSDIAPEFLRQPVTDPSVLEMDVDSVRDRWEFEAVEGALTRLPLHFCIFCAEVMSEEKVIRIRLRPTKTSAATNVAVAGF